MSNEHEKDIQTLEEVLPHLNEAILAARRLQGHCETCGSVANMSPIAMAHDLGKLAETFCELRMMLRTKVFSEIRPTGSNIRLYFPKSKDASG